jgi:hypothetical protein
VNFRPLHQRFGVVGLKFKTLIQVFERLHVALQFEVANCLVEQNSCIEIGIQGINLQTLIELLNGSLYISCFEFLSSFVFLAVHDAQSFNCLLTWSIIWINSQSF